MNFLQLSDGSIINLNHVLFTTVKEFEETYYIHFIHDGVKFVIKEDYNRIIDILKEIHCIKK